MVTVAGTNDLLALCVAEEQERPLTAHTLLFHHCVEGVQYYPLCPAACGILLCMIGYRVSRALPSAEPAIFIDLFSFFESLTLMMLL